MKNKKLLVIIAAIVVVVVVVAVVLLAGGNSTSEKEYKLGMGVVVGLDESKTGTAQIDATVATVVLDAEGKIVACRLDAIQNKITLNKETGAFTIGDLRTKMEKGIEYGMSTSKYSSDNNGDGVIKEWNEQAMAFENYVVGMTVDQVKAIGTKTLDNGYVIATDDKLLSAGCTIQITDFVAAVVKACNDEFAASFKTAGTIKLGIAAKSYDDESVAATEEKNGTIKVYSDIAATALVDGKIVATVNDAIQPSVSYTVAGEIAGKTFKGTKRELKGAYGMGQTSINDSNKWMDNNGDGKVLEWYEQSAVFSAFITGMTGAEVNALKTQEVNNHDISRDDALLNAGCTIQITGIRAVVVKAVFNAR